MRRVSGSSPRPQLQLSSSVMVTNHGVRHLAIIMDGNRRWAKARGLDPFAGHRQGRAVAKQASEWCINRGIEILTLYAFSTENWNRSKKEVGFLFRLLETVLTKDLHELHQKNIRLMVIGRVAELPKRLQQRIALAVERTKDNTRGTLQLAINYGGRSEIVDAMKKIYRTAQSASKITEQSIGEAMYTASQPDPDLIVRTSGEQRLSGFLPWQGVYSELVFLKKNWPDFTEHDLDEVLTEFRRRQRRFGT